MSSGDPKSEIERMRAETQALNEQVKLLVRTESQLHRAQEENARETARVVSLARLTSLANAAEDPMQVLELALGLLAEHLDLDGLGAAMTKPGVGWHVASNGGRLEVAPRLALSEWLEQHRHAMVQPLNDLPRRALLEVLPGFPSPAVDGFALTVPLLAADGTHDAFLCAWKVGTRTSFYRDGPSAKLVPFLEMFKSHLEQVLYGVELKRQHRMRGEQLEAANRELTESLKALETTQAQLLQSAKMEAIGRLAGGVAHDFNNLLAVVMMHASLLQESPLDESAADDVKQILGASERAARIAGQLLAFGRRQPTRPQEIELNFVVTELTKMLGRLVGSNYELALHLFATPLTVFADRAQVEQALMNLVINARDAMPAGGTITLTIRRSDDGPKPAAVIEVADNGVGIDEATRAKIFEPFFTTKGLGKGTGLGLAVVYGVAKEAGGDISVRSEPGKGATFSLSLPLSSVAEAVAPAQEERPKVMPGARVLLVDDEDGVRAVSARALRQNGYAVTEARHGAEALSCLEGGAMFDLVVTDVVMPVMGGMQLVTQLHLRWPTLKTLYISGYSVDPVDAASERVLQKPFSPPALLKAVYEALQP